MELNELLQEDEDALFKEYLSIPTISHAYDQRRFIRYALVAHANESGFNNERENALRARGLNDRQIKTLRTVFSWLGQVLEVLNER